MPLCRKCEEKLQSGLLGKSSEKKIVSRGSGILVTYSGVLFTDFRSTGSLKKPIGTRKESNTMITDAMRR
jgi:hypothetical protein